MESLTFILDRYGLPTVVTLVVLTWTARKILEPLVARHAAYLDATAAAYTALAAAFQALTAAVQQQTAILERLPCLPYSDHPPTPSACAKL